MKRPLLLVLLTAAPALADPQVCTEMACVDGVHLDVSPDYHWTPGHYRFSFDADGQTTLCEGSLPLRADCQPSITCQGPLQPTIMESGCALPAEAQGFGGIQIAGHPTRLAVSIERDGQALLNRDIPLAYSPLAPNGPQCGGQCVQAGGNLGLTPP